MKLREVEDDFPMPFGAFKGQPLGKVPAYYLLWVYRQQKLFGKLKEYIEKNKVALEEEAGMPSMQL